MKQLSAIRSTFLDYFARNGHEVVSSSPLVPLGDPTLMFTNAGMNQFKDVFTGAEKRGYNRATTSQKCVRAGGKHNDLDNVGYTARHHTFFEMLGNFSFGDYFKEGAIPYAWELLTKEYGLNKDKLWITIYHDDDTAFDIWKKVSGFSDNRIIRINSSDNFWSMGDTGPCGPCSEIYYNFEKDDPKDIINAGDDCVEIWNLVFMQYEQVSKDVRNNLPKPSIDTGMGLERLASVLQGVRDNYDTDLFKALIAASEELSKTKAEGDKKASHRVIADHLRSSCFLIADGVLPSNEGRGYVLRRIMRRAMRHVHMLGAKEPLMYKLVPTLIAQMGEAYPELVRAQAFVTENLRLEEERFKQTLDRGLKLLDEESASLKAGEKFSGVSAFKLYDTYGFPLDLTEDILRSRNITVDNDSFTNAMQEQKERARAAWSGSGEKATGRIWFELKEQVGATEFLGYTQTTAAARIQAIVVDEKPVTAVKAGQKALMLFNQTPFYGESGGQVGDSGYVGFSHQVIAEVTDTQKPLEGLHVHHITMKEGELKVGDLVDLHVDASRRNHIRANHSATHILHAVLRKQLGEHITQKGSLVSADRLRFDISHPKALTKEEITTIEREVNRVIWANSHVNTALMTPEDAIKKGAMALFGEKYGDEVRVLSMGISDEKGTPYSVELCGGTHVSATGDIGVFKIISEGAVAAGVRRIEAVTNGAAFDYLAGQDLLLKEIAGELKTKPEELNTRIAALVEDRKKLEKELADAKRQLAMGGSGGAALEKEMIGAIAFAAKVFDDLPAKELRTVAEAMLKQLGEGVIALASKAEGKASFVVAVTPSLTARVSAVDLVKTAAAAVGGKGGGGRPEMAQAGGAELEKIDAAMHEMRSAIEKAA
jgi:alanyl-tRNA synthetase